MQSPRFEPDHKKNKKNTISNNIISCHNLFMYSGFIKTQDNGAQKPLIPSC